MFLVLTCLYLTLCITLLVSLIDSCQRYEGGFGGDVGNEAHGGYTFCAVAALVLLQRTDLIDLHSLMVK